MTVSDNLSLKIGNRHSENNNLFFDRSWKVIETKILTAVHVAAFKPEFNQWIKDNLEFMVHIVDSMEDDIELIFGSNADLIMFRMRWL